MLYSVYLNILKFNNKEDIVNLVKEYIKEETYLSNKNISEIIENWFEIPNEEELEYFFRYVRNNLIKFQGLNFNDIEDEEEINKYLKSEIKYFNKFKENIEYPCYFSFFKIFVSNEDTFHYDILENDETEGKKYYLNSILEYFKNNNIEHLSEYIMISFDEEE